MGPLAILVSTYAAFFAVLWIWRRYSSPVRYLPGPKSSSFIFGSLRDISAEDPHSQVKRWAEEYGHVVKFTALFGEERLSITDTKALNHILMNNYDYQKDDGLRWTLYRTLGHGLLSVEEDRHKNQRRVMNPAFGSAQLRELSEIFVQKSSELAEILDGECSQSPDGEKSVNITSWLNRTTLDIIGLAGFNYNFNSLRPDGPPNALNEAFAAIFTYTPFIVMVQNLQMYFPFLRRLPLLFRRELTRKRAKKTMEAIGYQLLNESRSALVGTGEKSDGWTAKDLLSLLVRANLASEEKMRMSDSEVVSQIATFFVAGHETTSTATSWAIYSLCLHPEIQTKLRNELLELETSTPTMHELDSLTYLDWVVKETLRYHPPVAIVTRVALKDDVIPLQRPYTDTQGVVHDTIRIKRGQMFEIPILAMNLDKDLWGPDAMEFKPERWENLPQSTSSIPGVWSHQLTFIGGPRACIGFRFAIIEFKAILFNLVRSFEFELAVPKEELVRTRTVITGPALKEDVKRGRPHSMLPVRIRRYRNGEE